MHSPSFDCTQKPTLNDLENATTRLGDAVRKFDQKVCCDYRTNELPTEHAARTRRRAAKGKNQPGPSGSSNVPSAATTARREKKFNMNTYKFHSLGDYVASIRLFGTTDSYTSQLVCSKIDEAYHTDMLTQKGELEHRRVKRFYPTVRKGAHTKGIGKEVQ